MALIKRVLHNRSAAVGLAIVLVYLVLFVLGALSITPFPANEQHPKADDRLQPPGATYVMGTDQFGRDVLSRVIRGTVYSLRVVFISVAIATVAGTLLGTISGFVGGYFDNLVMRLLDIFFAFPAILLALAVISAVGPGPYNVIPAIAVVYTPIFARVARAPVLSIRLAEYVTAARSIGTRGWRILFRHILPNSLDPVLVTTSLALSWALLTEAGLSFLGLGPQPPEASWGLMLKEARNFVESAPWLAIFPGLAIMLAVLGFNLLGDGLRDIFDPRTRK
jgi:peptide/nickel transport system permease protein